LLEVASQEDLFTSLSDTGQNLLHDFDSKGTPSEEFSTELSGLKEKWAKLQTILNDLHEKLHKETSELNEYLDKLSDFSERLNAVYSEFYDEFCTAIPPNASQETINRQKMILEVNFRVDLTLTLCLVIRHLLTHSIQE